MTAFSLLLLAALQQPAPAAPARLPTGSADTSPFRRLALPTPTLLREGSGQPGPRYWQQRADYVIRAALDTAAHTITGRETIRYTNNSPDTLRYLWLQVDQNIYRTDSRGAAINPTDARFAGAGFVGGYTIESFGEVLAGPRTARGPTTRVEPLHTTVNSTMLRAELDRPLAPGRTITLDVAYHFQVPEHGSDRMGRKQYPGQGEFYLEYGDFDVAITVPRRYVVATTGTLLNPAEVLTATQRERLARAIRSDSAREALALGRGEHLGRIEERAGGGDDVAARHGDRDVEIAVLEIELALPQVLLGVPAAYVVVDRHPRIPLGDLVQPAARVLLAAHAVGAVLGDLEVVGDVERDGPSRRERPVQLGAQHRAVHRRVQRLDAGRGAPRGARPREHLAERFDRVAAHEARAREARVGGVDRGAAAVGAVDVLVHLQPQIAERVGRVVGVADRLAARDRVRRRVERRADHVVGALLPVAWPRLARAFAQQGRRRQRETAERRGVGAAGREARGSGRRGLLERREEQQREGGHAVRTSVGVATAARKIRSADVDPHLVALAARRFGPNRVPPGGERPALPRDRPAVHEPADGAGAAGGPQGQRRVARVHADGESVAVAALGGENVKGRTVGRSDSRTVRRRQSDCPTVRLSDRGRPLSVLHGPCDAGSLVPVARPGRLGPRQEPLVHAGAVGRREQAREPAHARRHEAGRRRLGEIAGCVAPGREQHRPMQQRARAGDAADALHRPAVEVPDPHGDGEVRRGRHRPVVGEVPAGAGLGRGAEREIERRLDAEARDAGDGVSEDVEDKGRG